MPKAKVGFFNVFRFFKNRGAFLLNEVPCALESRESRLILPEMTSSASAFTARCYRKYLGPQWSDHAPFIERFVVNSDSGTLVPWTKPMLSQQMVTLLSWNLMMQGKRRRGGYNNAYKLEETDEVYLARFYRNFEVIFELMRIHPDIGLIMLQEAPIREDHIEMIASWFEKRLMRDEKWYLDSTQFGILSLVNRDKIPGAIIKLQSVYAGEMQQMNDRSSTFELTGINASVTNAHLPHDDPTAALQLLAGMLKHNVGASILANHAAFSHIIAADMNLDPHVVKETLVTGLAALFPHSAPIDFNMTVTSSLEGHKKAIKSGEEHHEHVTVDSCVTLTYKTEPRLLSALQASILRGMDAPVLVSERKLWH